MKRSYPVGNCMAICASLLGTANFEHDIEQIRKRKQQDAIGEPTVPSSTSYVDVPVNPARTSPIVTPRSKPRQSNAV